MLAKRAWRNSSAQLRDQRCKAGRSSDLRPLIGHDGEREIKKGPQPGE